MGARGSHQLEASAHIKLAHSSMVSTYKTKVGLFNISDFRGRRDTGERDGVEPIAKNKKWRAGEFIDLL